MVRLRRRGGPLMGAVGLASTLLVGCYSYTPLPVVAPAPRTRVALVLSDQGRVGAGPAVGSGVARVEGALLGSTDSDYTLRVAAVTDIYTLRVAAVTDIRGAKTRWSGETITLQRPWVGNAYERRFSKSRTYVLLGALAAGFVAFAVSRDLFGGGGPLIETPPGGGGGGQE